LIKNRLPQKGTLDKSQPRDLFRTPRYGTDIILPYIPKHITQIWECAAGECYISEYLNELGYDVISTDIRGDELEGVDYHNFLTDEIPSEVDLSKCAILTNPPYSLKRKFFNKCVEHNMPFALLLSSDYCQWTIDAIRKDGCEKVVPYRRINFITPTFKSEKTGSTAYFHTLWMTRYFNIGKTETFVELTKKQRENY
jgi:hypothetical protein